VVNARLREPPADISDSLGVYISVGGGRRLQLANRRDPTGTLMTEADSTTTSQTGGASRCIYCCTPIDVGKGVGDHVIPDALGEFVGGFRFRRICPQCNSIIGACEQQLVSCAPESFLRNLIKPQSKRSRRRGASGFRSAMGAAAPVFTVETGDHSVPVEPSRDDPRNVHPVDAVTVHDKAGEKHHIPLLPGMAVKDFKERVEALGIGPPKKVYLDCGECNYDEFRELIEETWPGWQWQQQRPTKEPGTYRVYGHAMYTINLAYFRSLAKIAFHYYLCCTQREIEGTEPEFEGVRSFIMSGGDKDEFFHSSGRTFMTPFGATAGGAAITSTRWSHILAVDESHDVVVAYVQLFVGPGWVPDPYYITLGRLKGRIVLPSYVHAHVYEYALRTDTHQTKGTVHKASVSRMR